MANGTLPLLDQLWVKSWAVVTKAAGGDSPLDAFAAKMGTSVAAIKSSFYLDWSHKRLSAADCLAIAQLAADGAFGKAKEVKLGRAVLEESVIGAEGKAALGTAVANGTLPLLDHLWLATNLAAGAASTALQYVDGLTASEDETTDDEVEATVEEAEAELMAQLMAEEAEIMAEINMLRREAERTLMDATATLPSTSDPMKKLKAIDELRKAMAGL